MKQLAIVLLTFGFIVLAVGCVEPRAAYIPVYPAPTVAPSSSPATPELAPNP